MSVTQEEYHIRDDRSQAMVPVKLSKKDVYNIFALSPASAEVRSYLENRRERDR